MKNNTYVIVVRNATSSSYSVYQFSMDGFTRMTGKHWAVSDVSMMDPSGGQQSTAVRYSNAVSHPNPFTLDTATATALTSTLAQVAQQLTSPQPTQSLSLTGTFSGRASDSSGPGQMTWQLSQAGDTVNGSLTANDSSTGITFNGTVGGTLTGNVLNFTMTLVPSGLTQCSSFASGTASNVTSTTIAGTYSGNNACTGPFTNGQFTLTKQ